MKPPKRSANQNAYERSGTNLKKSPNQSTGKVAVDRGITKRERARFPWFPLLIACVLAACFIFGPHSWEDLARFSQYIDVEAATSAQAEVKPKSEEASGKKSAKTDEEAAKSAQNSEASKAEKKDETKSWTPEEITLFRSLEQRKKDLDRREADLNRMEEELQKQKVELESRLKTLEDTRRKIASQLSEKVQTDQERVEKLVTMYSNMKPGSAANVFKDMNEDLVVEILGKMKQKNAAEILNLLPSEKAQRLSEKFAGYRRSGA